MTLKHCGFAKFYFVAQTSTTGYCGSREEYIGCSIDFSCALTQTGKKVFATIHLEGNQARIVHSSSPSTQGRLGPALVGDTKVVAQKMVDLFKNHGVMSYK